MFQRRFTMKHLLLLLALTTIFTSCGQVSSEDVEQDIIETDYYLNYSAENSSLEASGKFTIGGNTTYVTLDGESNLKVNSAVTKIDVNLFGQVSYVFKQSSAYQMNKNYQFVYTNKDQDKFVNNSTLPSSVTLSVPASIESDENLFVDWNVDQVNDQATSMYVGLSYDNGYTTHPVSAKDSNGQLELNSVQLSEYRGQTIKLHLCRTRVKRNIENPGAGGRLEARYCSANKTVELKL